MFKSSLTGLLAAGIAVALASSQAGEAAGVKGSAGTVAESPPVIQVPQTPPPPILNPGVTPSAPGPSAITPNPRDSAGLVMTVMPGPATGNSLPTGRVHGSRSRATREQTRAMNNKVDREIDRGISICRGC